MSGAGDDHAADKADDPFHVLKETLRAVVAADGQDDGSAPALPEDVKKTLRDGAVKSYLKALKENRGKDGHALKLLKERNRVRELQNAELLGAMTLSCVGCGSCIAHVCFPLHLHLHSLALALALAASEFCWCCAL